MIRTLFNLTAVTALASPFALNVGASASPLVINSATALAGPLNINSGDAATGTMLAKYAPTRGTPVIIYWGNAGTECDQVTADHPAWRDKSTWICNFASFNTGYYPVPGYPAAEPALNEWNSNQVGGPQYASYDYSTYKIDCTDTELQDKIDAHAAHDAQLIAQCLHKQGLLRGRGPIGNGNYGGAFSHHELFSDGEFKEINAHYSFTNLLRDPDDAALVDRTQPIYSGKVEGTYTARADSPVTLFKLGPQGQINQDLMQTVAGRAAIEANNEGARPGNFHHLICTNGIAAVKRYVEALRDEVKAACDSYVPPGETEPVELCYPAYVLNDLEAFSGRASFHDNGYINPPDAPTPGGPGYYITGALWHVMGPHDNPHPTWNMKIFESGDNFSFDESYKTAIENDPVVSSFSRFAPPLNPVLSVSDDQHLHFGRITFHAVDYAMYKAFNEPWKEEFPFARISNYEFCIVKDDDVPYERPAIGGTRSIQKILRHDNQAPSLYGNYGNSNPLNEAIREASGEIEIAAAVEAWNDEYFPRVMSIIDAIDDKRPIDAYIYGVYDVMKYRSGQTREGWGGDKAFFKRLVKALWQRGIYKYVIFAGDATLTYEAWNEVQAEIRAGDFDA